MTTAEKQVHLLDLWLYINRELSWLGFNERVLAQAKDKRHPLLERVSLLRRIGSLRSNRIQTEAPSRVPSTVSGCIVPQRLRLYCGASARALSVSDSKR
jgi:hypothetical protein